MVPSWKDKQHGALFLQKVHSIWRIKLWGGGRMWHLEKKQKEVENLVRNGSDSVRTRELKVYSEDEKHLMHNYPLIYSGYSRRLGVREAYAEKCSSKQCYCRWQGLWITVSLNLSEDTWKGIMCADAYFNNDDDRNGLQFDTKQNGRWAADCGTLTVFRKLGYHPTRVLNCAPLPDQF